MGFSWLFFFSSLSISFLLTLTVAQQYYRSHSCNDSSGNFTRNSAYETNLNRLLSSFSFNTPNNHGFYEWSSSLGSDTAYAFALCRGDVNSSDCISCINNATGDLRNRCPNQKEAIIWYDYCMFRYANRATDGLALDPIIYMWNIRNVTDVRPFIQVQDTLLRSLRNTASLGTSLGKFATGSAEVTPSQILYALVQCTPDLTEADCIYCLTQAIVRAPDCCDGKQGGRVLMPSCNFRFETERFYNPTIADTPIPSSPPPTLASPVSPAPSNDTRSKTDVEDNKQGKSKWIPIVASLSTIFGLTLLCSGGVFLWRRRKFHENIDHDTQEVQLLEVGGIVSDDYSNENFQSEGGVRSQEFTSFQLDILQVATEQFCDENKLGQGGFGPVYKGKLADGREIAVKRLSRTSGQGLLEFKNEVMLIAKLQHRNLVRLLGCCLEKNEKLLVYEFMPNKSLDVFLFDQEMNPKISDFGMARIFGGNQNEANTNRVVGTYGYMAPEYAMEGLFSVKSDVFSFGVLLLEIISGKKNSGFHHLERGESLLTFAWKLWSKSQGMELIDPVLILSCVANEVLKCIHIGLLCVQEDPADRPTMSSVIVMLASENITLPLPAEPAFSVGRVVAEPSQSTSNDGVHSVNEVTISNMSPR